MQTLTPTGQQLVNELSARYNLSPEAVFHMLLAVNNGGGTMAQFNSPELGGSGQWMQGGMTMVGDMFNNNLKFTVDNLCNELSNALSSIQIFPLSPQGNINNGYNNEWWPKELGQPFSSGAQNNLRYAIFPQRLAIETHGQVIIYDTLDHQISGISQQQGSGNTLNFTSQYGVIQVSSLPLVSGATTSKAEVDTNFSNAATKSSAITTTTPKPNTHQATATPNDSTGGDVVTLLEKLGQLHEAGILSNEEFSTKKAELLSRL